MLIRSFRTSDSQFTIEKWLTATCALCNDKESRAALLRHGVIEALQQCIINTVRSADPSSIYAPQNVSSSFEILSICVKVIAKLAKCSASRSSLSDNTATALVLADSLRWQYGRVGSSSHMNRIVLNIGI